MDTPHDPTIALRLAERAKPVPPHILAKARGLWDDALAGNPLDDEDLRDVLAWIESYFAPLLVPGPEYQSDAPADWKPSGHADGVIYLAGIRNAQNQDRWIEGLEGLQRTALRYLKKPSPLECATRMALEGRDFISGFAVPQTQGLFRYCPGISAWAQDVENDRRHGEEVRNFFTIADAAIDAVQLPHRNRWIIRKPERGIWCVFYA
jgi:hypothetical protein